jgi:hypothetical protein
MQNLFTPTIDFRRTADGTLVLHATVTAPNGCYSAGEATVEDGIELEPFPIGDGPVAFEPQPVVRLNVQYMDKTYCTQALKTLRFRAELGDVEGDVVLVETAVDGRTMSRMETALPTQKTAAPDSGLVEAEDFNAFLNKLPGPGANDPTLTVSGTAVLADPGFDAELVAADESTAGEVRSSLDPIEGGSTLFLELTVTEREGIFPQVIDRETVRFRTSGPDAERYERVVVVEPSGAFFTLPVTVVV